MPQLATSLLSWSEKLGLNTEFRAAKFHTISGLTCENCGNPQDITYFSSNIHSIFSTQCHLCDMPGLDKADCQIFVNSVLATHFAKEDPAAATKCCMPINKLGDSIRGAQRPRYTNLWMSLLNPPMIWTLRLHVPSLRPWSMPSQLPQLTLLALSCHRRAIKTPV
jgi:hypothetical protein